MKVVFVCSENKKQGIISPIVQAQADSLFKEGIDVIIYPVRGAGIVGYLKNIIPLIRFIQKQKPDIVHAHYSLCGFIAGITTKRPVITSLMGSFPSNNLKKKFVKFYIRNQWTRTIVKSQKSAIQLNEKGLFIVPNGVNLDIFKSLNKNEARSLCGFSEGKKFVIFVSDPARPEKNYFLASSAMALLNNPEVELICVYNKPHEEVAQYMIAADVLLLTSLKEGSPNVIKEAMACNLPIVSTNVGDVAWLLDGVIGCFVAETFEASEIAELLKITLTYNNSNGRKRLESIGLDSKTVAHKLIDIYEMVLHKEN